MDKAQYQNGEKRQKEIEDLIKEDKEKLEKLKIDIATQEIEYLAKEKQISTFLECKKTFFGKFKYYFKYSKKGNKGKIRQEDKQDQLDDIDKDEYEELPQKKRKKENYTIED